MRKVSVNLWFPVPDWLYHRLKRVYDNVHRSVQERKQNLVGDRDIEWSWVAGNIPRGPGAALDFGPGGSFLGLIAAHRGFDVQALDLETINWPYVHERLKSVRGDILSAAFPKKHFDLVLNCSTVEHVGLSGRYGVTREQTDGDLEAMRVLRDVMKPSGTMLLTIPVGKDGVFPPLARVYGEERLPRLIQGFTVKSETFWTKEGSNRWVITKRSDALRSETFAGSWNPLENYYGIGCFVLVPQRQ